MNLKKNFKFGFFKMLIIYYTLALFQVKIMVLYYTWAKVVLYVDMWRKLHKAQQEDVF
jgi:hypothetical protein